MKAGGPEAGCAVGGLAHGPEVLILADKADPRGHHPGRTGKRKTQDKGLYLSVSKTKGLF